jgi:hypothetical protein
MAKPLLARFAVAIAVAAALSGCVLRSPSVAELKYNPGRYRDRTVVINGVVTNSWGVPFVQMYRVSDGTGEVTVIANNGRRPSKGDRVRVKGRVNEVATFGGQSVGLHIQERDLDFKR